MSEQPKLTPALRDMLERIARQGEKGLMLLAITAAGGREGAKLDRLRRAGWVEWCDYPLKRGPVDGVRVTEAGRRVLLEKGKHT